MENKTFYRFIAPSGSKIILFIIISSILGFYVRESSCAINISLLDLSCADSVGFPSASYSLKGVGSMPDSAITNSFSAKYAMQAGGISFYPPNIIFNLAVYYLFICLLFWIKNKYSIKK